MLERNSRLHVLRENEISIKVVFNTFYETNTDIIYVVDTCDLFVGVITLRQFLQSLKLGGMG